MFERKSMEQIMDKMISWTRGSTNKLTDFRVGSKVRTLYESVAVVIEEFYEKVHRAMRLTVEENIYAVIGFDKLPATYATGIVRFGKGAPAEDNLYIPMGTIVKSRSTPFKSPMKYQTTADAILEIGKSYVDVQVIAIQPGTIGNAGTGEINEFETKPNGIESVTNLSAFLNGQEEETKDAQKTRFQRFIQANTRGVLQSVKYGASTATVKDASGNVIERVVQCVAIEDLVNKLGQVDIYVWNGVGNASEALKNSVKNVLTGEYVDGSTPVYGYKPAGIIPNVYTANLVDVMLRIQITHDATTTEDEVRIKAEQEVDRYFAELGLGDTLIQTALEANIKYIDGIQDVKVHLSTDKGIKYHTDNIIAKKTEIIVPTKPIHYV